MNNPPLLQRLAFDPILGNVKADRRGLRGGPYRWGTFQPGNADRVERKIPGYPGGS